MSRYVRSEPGTPRFERAAELVADGHLTREEIARQVSITDRQLYRWLTWERYRHFRCRVEELRAQTRATVLREGVTLKQNRLDRLNDAWRRLQCVINERAEEGRQVNAERRARGAVPGSLDGPVPGAETGLLVRAYKQAGRRLVEEWVLDVALLKEFREIEKQAAQELGEWVERRRDEVRADVQLGDPRLSLDEREAIRAVLTGRNGS